MLYAIISDIHSNLEAFEETLKRTDEIRVNEILCLGDIVGYNANPNECVKIIKERQIKTIMGNHDRTSCGIEEPTSFNEYAKEAVFWTRKEITAETQDYLKNLKDSIVIDNEFLVVHGSPRDPDEYILSRSSAAQNLQYLKKNFKNITICFFGHTHVKAFYSLTGESGIVSNSSEGIVLSGDGTFLINPGSVGQPRDRDPRGFFIIFDTEKRLVRYEPVAYDIEKTSLKVINAGLPKFLAERLFEGR